PPQPSHIPPVTYQPQFTDNTQLDTELDEEQLFFLTGRKPNTLVDEVVEGLVQDIAQNEDNIFQADQLHRVILTLSEVQDHDNCLDNMNESHEEHEIYNDVQQDDVVDLDTKYMCNSNIISYEQYLQENDDQVVHSDVSSVPSDAVIIITNDVYEQDAQCVTSKKSNNTVNASLTTELSRYKELA
nr:hypothetical protein [Tanacetum cinerariifolium]